MSATLSGALRWLRLGVKTRVLVPSNTRRAPPHPAPLQSFSGSSGVKGSPLPRVQLSQAGRPSPPLCSGRGPHAPLQRARRRWREGLLTEGAGPPASSVARPVTRGGPPAPAPVSADGGRPVGPGESGLPAAPRPAGRLLQGLALEAAGAPGASGGGSQDFRPRSGDGVPPFPRTPSAHLCLPLPPFLLPSFPLHFLTGGHCHPAL